MGAMRRKARSAARTCRKCGARTEKQMRFCKKCWREIKARPLTQEEIDLKNSPLGITLGL